MGWITKKSASTPLGDHLVCMTCQTTYKESNRGRAHTCPSDIADWGRDMSGRATAAGREKLKAANTRAEVERDIQRVINTAKQELAAEIGTWLREEFKELSGKAEVTQSSVARMETLVEVLEHIDEMMVGTPVDEVLRPEREDGGIVIQKGRGGQQVMLPSGDVIEERFDCDCADCHAYGAH